MEIGDLTIIPFVLAITEGLKSLFGIEGKANQIVAFSVATVLVLLSSMIDRAILPPEVAQWIEMVVWSVGGGLSAIGVYDYAKARIPRVE